MNRRALLAATAAGVGTGLGACLGRGGSSLLGNDQPSTDERTISLVEQDAPDLDVSVRAEMQQTQVTPESTASLAVTLTNEGPPRTIRVDDGSKCALFNRDRGRSTPDGLWLYHESKIDFLIRRFDRSGERWSLDRDPHEPRGFAAYGCPGRDFDAGESVTARYHVWDDYRTQQYMLPGTYRFEAPIVVWEQDIDDRSSFDWGFEVLVEARD